MATKCENVAKLALSIASSVLKPICFLNGQQIYILISFSKMVVVAESHKIIGLKLELNANPKS